jgi:hypothetical protein
MRVAISSTVTCSRLRRMTTSSSQRAIGTGRRPGRRPARDGRHARWARRLNRPIAPGWPRWSGQAARRAIPGGADRAPGPGDAWPRWIGSGPESGGARPPALVPPSRRIAGTRGAPSERFPGPGRRHPVGPEAAGVSRSGPSAAGSYGKAPRAGPAPPGRRHGPGSEADQGSDRTKSYQASITKTTSSKCQHRMDRRDSTTGSGIKIVETTPCLIVLLEPRMEMKVVRTLSSTSYPKHRPGGNRDL